MQWISQMQLAMTARANYYKRRFKVSTCVQASITLQLRDASGIALDLQKEKESLKRENFELKDLLDSSNSVLETLQNVQVIFCLASNMLWLLRKVLNELIAASARVCS